MCALVKGSRCGLGNLLLIVVDVSVVPAPSWLNLCSIFAEWSYAFCSGSWKAWVEVAKTNTQLVGCASSTKFVGPFRSSIVGRNLTGRQARLAMLRTSTQNVYLVFFVFISDAATLWMTTPGFPPNQAFSCIKSWPIGKVWVRNAFFPSFPVVLFLSIGTAFAFSRATFLPPSPTGCRDRPAPTHRRTSMPNSIVLGGQPAIPTSYPGGSR